MLTEELLMRIQLEIPDLTAMKLKNLMEEAGVKTYSEIFGYALTGLDWMVKERRAGRLVLSTDPTFNQFKELSMPILEAVTPPPAKLAPDHKHG
jgi:hypothetical protein